MPDCRITDLQLTTLISSRPLVQVRASLPSWVYAGHLLTWQTGTFARVWFARLKAAKEPNKNIFALKILRKAEGKLYPIPPNYSRSGEPLSNGGFFSPAVIKLKQVEHVRNESKCLSKAAGHPFITTLITTFSDEQCLYMLVWTYHTFPFLSFGLTFYGTPRLTMSSLNTALAAKYSASSGELADSTNTPPNSTPPK